MTGDNSPVKHRVVRLLPLLLTAIILSMAYTARSQSNSASTKPVKKSGASKSTKSAHTTASANKQWVETTLRKMTDDEKIGQLLFTTYHGSFTSTDADAYRKMMQDVDDLHVGGFINITQMSPLGIIKSQVYPTAVLTNQLQARSKLPLLIGADFERGSAMRLDEGTSFPTAMALAAAGNPADAYTMGKITTLEARAVGIHWIYAPVADY
jgi:beta-N-acetylhexosaminidase